MAFPEQPIIHSGNHADGPVGVPWSAQGLGNGLIYNANSFQSAIAGSGGAVWMEDWDADCEAFYTIGSSWITSGGSYELFLNLQNWTTSSFSGYIFRFWNSGGSGSGQFELDRADAGSLTRLNTLGGITLSAGDVLGIRMRGGTVTTWRNGTQQQSASDSTYYKGGRAGFRFLNDGSQTGRMVNWGGGPVPPLGLSISTQGNKKVRIAA